MSDSKIETQIETLLPDVRRNLESSLSVHVKARYPVEDIVHDTYVRAIEKLDTLRQTNRTAVVAWLQRIAHRLVIDKIRRKQSHQVDGSQASAIYSALTASGQLTPSREVSVSEAMHTMQRGLECLPEHLRIVLELRYVEQLTFAEIGERLDRTPGAARGLHRTALRSLKKDLGGSSIYFFRS